MSTVLTGNLRGEVREQPKRCNTGLAHNALQRIFMRQRLGTGQHGGEEEMRHKTERHDEAEKILCSTLNASLSNSTNYQSCIVLVLCPRCNPSENLLFC